MAKTAKFSLKLLIDEKRNKVVLAEANQDFVDVLYSLLTLPMGQVARLLKGHTNLLSCFKNLNKSVADMGTEHFETEACKSMLLNPKSSKEIQCRRLKLNMGDDTDPTMFFMCPNYSSTKECSCTNQYSNFNTSRCCCGTLMSKRVYVSEEDIQVGEVIGNSEDGVFVNCRSSFIVTDDLNVTLNSIGSIMKVLNDQGYSGFTDLKEALLDVGYEEVVTLLGCLFTSDATLSCAFLKKPCMTRILKVQTPPVPKNDNVCYMKVFVRKFDREILYAECDEVFVDSILSCLTFPLEMACSLSNDKTILGCVENMCRSPCRRYYCFDQHRHFYYCTNDLFGYFGPSYRSYECLIPPERWRTWKFATKFERSSLAHGEKVVTVFANDPKVKSGRSTSRGTSTGFMKKTTKFIVSNDLIITPMNSSSTIDLLRKMQIDFSDLEEHPITISRAHLINILRASLISSSALTKGLSYLLVKKPKEET